MKDGSWPWSTLTKESFPNLDGKPKYLADKRTCVVPVKLDPAKTYAIWLNCAKFGNFKDADDRSAVPYLLVFKTKPYSTGRQRYIETPLEGHSSTNSCSARSATNLRTE